MTPPNQSKPEVHTLESGCHPDCPDYQERKVLPEAQKVDEDLEAASEAFTLTRIAQFAAVNEPGRYGTLAVADEINAAHKAGAEWQKAKDAKETEVLKERWIECAESHTDVEMELRDLKLHSAKVREQTLMEVIDFLKTDLMSASSGGTWARVIKSQFLLKREEKK